MGVLEELWHNFGIYRNIGHIEKRPSLAWASSILASKPLMLEIVPRYDCHRSPHVFLGGPSELRHHPSIVVAVLNSLVGRAGRRIINTWRLYT